MRASGPVPFDTIQKLVPRGWKRSLMKRMPTSRLDTEEIMQRIVTVLLKNMEEKFRDAPMRTANLMKEVGLRGAQIKEKGYINDALYLLMGQKVIHKVKQNPIRWEIHEEYRKYGVPPVSWDKRKPWAMTHLLHFERTKVPKYGPIHGQYRPQDRQFLIEHNLPLTQIHDPFLRSDPFAVSDFRLRDPMPPKGSRRPPLEETLPRAPKDKDGNLVQMDQQSPRWVPREKPDKIVNARLRAEREAAGGLPA
ncbi:unnamed protein product [Polarella glacialis]|nr:unnamed protein product [Polarella glacialis]